MKLLRAVVAAVVPGSRPPSGPGRRGRFGVLLTVGVVALVAAALGLALNATVGLPGQATDRIDQSPRIQALAQRAGPLVAFSEFGLEADTLWAANPNNPDDRIRLGGAEHAEGYGIVPALSPDGERIAYTALPPGADGTSLGPNAELWVLLLADGQARRLAEDIDLRSAPVWSPGGDSVVVRRSAWDDATQTGSSELFRVGLDGSSTSLASSSDGLFSIDFSPDGAWFYYATLSASGTDLLRAPVSGGSAEVVAHLSDGFSREWQLSPDGSRLVYLSEASADATVAFVTEVLDLTTGDRRAPLARRSGEEFSPVWEPGGALTVGSLEGSEGSALRLDLEGDAEGAAALPRGKAGFDAPLSWSPDGVYLAVRSFEGTSTSDPGPSRVEVVGVDGSRGELSRNADVIIAGWLEASQ